MKVKEITGLFSEELKEIYADREIKNLAFFVLEEVLGYSRAEVIINHEKEIDKEKLTSIINALGKLKQEIPIQYIFGKAEFYGLPFIVNNDVLIPRPETEELVEWIIKDNINSAAKILDIGTGSGCIAIALKKNIPGSSVFAVDISEDALNVARENALINNVQINFSIVDILNYQSSLVFPEVDIIISNPPYIRSSEKVLMKNIVVQNEPQIALFVQDDDPLVFYKSITSFAMTHLIPDGNIYFEINENLSSELVNMIESEGDFKTILREDLNGKKRMIKCSFKSH